MSMIYYSVITDDIPLTETYMDLEPFDIDDVMCYAVSDAMREFLILHGADRGIPSITNPCGLLNYLISPIKRFIYELV